MAEWDVVKVFEARDPARLDLVSSFIVPDRVRFIRMADDLVYVGVRPTDLVVVDLSDPSDPRMVGTYTGLDEPRDMWISQPLSFVLDRDGVHVLDVDEPTLMVRKGFLDLADPYTLTVQNGLLYIAGGSHGLQIVDVHDPDVPVLLSQTLVGGNAYDVCVDGSIAYVSSSLNGLVVVDASDPIDPVVISSPLPELQAWGIGMHAGRVLVTDQNQSLVVIDASDPAHLVQTGLYHFEGNASAIEIIEGRAYVGVNQVGVVILDANNMSMPPLVRAITGNVNFEDFTIQDTLALITASGRGLMAFDMTSWETPRLLGSYTTLSPSSAVAIRGTLACMADGSSGFYLFSVADPRHPELFWNEEGYGRNYWDVALQDGFALFAAGSRGLLVFDITDPRHPMELVTPSGSGDARDLQVVGHLAYLSRYQYGLEIIDIEDPAHPVSLSRTQASGLASYLLIAGTTAYLSGTEGITIFDVSDPTAPLQTGFFAGASGPMGIYMGFLLVGDGDWVRLIDVRRPEQPTLVGSYLCPGRIQFLAVQVDLAAIGFTGGMHIINLSDCALCPVDWNADGRLNVYDMLIFLELFSANHPGADLNADQTVDYRDVEQFLSEFASGC